MIVNRKQLARERAMAAWTGNSVTLADARFKSKSLISFIKNHFFRLDLGFSYNHRKLRAHVGILYIEKKYSSMSYLNYQSLITLSCNIN